MLLTVFNVNIHNAVNVLFSWWNVDKVVVGEVDVLEAGQLEELVLHPPHSLSFNYIFNYLTYFTGTGKGNIISHHPTN